MLRTLLLVCPALGALIRGSTPEDPEDSLLLPQVLPSPAAQFGILEGGSNRA